MADTEIFGPNFLRFETSVQNHLSSFHLKHFSRYHLRTGSEAWAKLINEGYFFTGSQNSYCVFIVINRVFVGALLNWYHIKLTH